MNRKDFLSAVVPVSAVAAAFPAKRKHLFEDAVYKIPPPLLKGDTIGICCPSGYISVEDIQPAVNKMKEWGFKISIGKTVGLKDFSFGGTDEERINDLQNMLDEPEIKAIMFARGGYGAVRIIDKLNFKKFVAEPKWIIGFSDATVFHSHLNKNFGIASIHSKMCNSFPADWSNADPAQIDSIESIRKCLTGEKVNYNVIANENNRAGIAEGVLIGGNLSILENLAGTPSDIDTDGKILFVEEVDEYLYSIDRMLWNLKRTAKFQKLKGLIVGGFNRIKPDDTGEEFGRTIYEIILEKVKPFNYPVCFEFPVGHQKNNVALKCGVRHKLIVTNENVMLQEI